MGPPVHCKLWHVKLDAGLVNFWDWFYSYRAASVTDDEIEGIYAKKRQATHTGLWTVISEHRLSENKQLDQTKLANIFVRVWNSFCMKMMSLCENFDADAAAVNPEQAHSSASKCVRLAKDVWRSCMVVKREVVALSTCQCLYVQPSTFIASS